MCESFNQRVKVQGRIPMAVVRIGSKCLVKMMLRYCTSDMLNNKSLSKKKMKHS